MPLNLLFGLIGISATTALPPTSKWVVDYEQNMCAAAREFGGKNDQRIVFAINPQTDMMSRSARLIIIVPNQTVYDTRAGRAKVTLQPSGESLVVEYVGGPLTGNAHGYRMSVGGPFMEKVAASSGILIAPGADRFELTTGPMRGVIDALDKCNQNLFQSWGVDPKAYAVPLTDPGTWFRSEDYPARAMTANIQGRPTIAITVSPDGRAAACRVVASSSNDILDKATCDTAIRRAKFEASATTGNRYSVLSVNWILGGRRR